MDQPVSTGPTGKDAKTDCASQLARQAELGSDLSLQEEVATGVDCDFVVGRPTSASMSSAGGCVDFAGHFAIDVTSPAVFFWGCHHRCGLPGRCWGGVLG